MRHSTQTCQSFRYLRQPSIIISHKHGRPIHQYLSTDPFMLINLKYQPPSLADQEFDFMDRFKRCTVLILFLFLIMSAIAHGQQDPVENAQRPNIFSKIFGSLFPFSSNSPATTTSTGTGTSFWDKVKAMINQAQISTPNLDFRGSDEAVGHGGGAGIGTGEKMKEAVAKSVEKGKETVEDSARTAAKIASETVQKTKEKVKGRLSDHKTQTNPQDEL